MEKKTVVVPGPGLALVVQYNPTSAGSTKCEVRCCDRASVMRVVQWFVLAVTLALAVAALSQMSGLRVDNEAMHAEVDQLREEVALLRRHTDHRSKNSDKELDNDERSYYRRNHRSTSRSRPTNLQALHFQNDDAFSAGRSDSNDLIWKQVDLHGSTLSSHHYSYDQDDNTLTLYEPGLYFIYSQRLYNNAQRSSYSVYLDDKALLKCVQDVDYVDQNLDAYQNSKMKTCYTAAVAWIQANQKIKIVNNYTGRPFYIDSQANYWGVVKLS